MQASGLPCFTPDGGWSSHELFLVPIARGLGARSCPASLRIIVSLHASLRQPLAQPLATNGMGSPKQWQPCTLAMAAGLTDHVWSLREVLMFRIPLRPHPQTV